MELQMHFTQINECVHIHMRAILKIKKGFTITVLICVYYYLYEIIYIHIHTYPFVWDTK